MVYVGGYGYLFNQLLNKSPTLYARRGYYEVPNEPIIPESFSIWLY